MLEGFLRRIDGAPFSNSATVRWSSPEGQVVFADPAEPNTTAIFAKPGSHTLRLRITEAGYVEEHELHVTIGVPEKSPTGLAIAGPDLILELDQSLRPDGIIESATPSRWSQVAGPLADIAADGAVEFSATGAHRFRLSARRSGITVFDDVRVVRGSGVLDMAPEGSLARHLVPDSPADLSDTGDPVWTAPAFVDSRWTLGSARYGFEREAGFQDQFARQR